MRDNHLNTCKECFKKNKNPESNRKASRKYRKNNPEKIREYNSLYRIENRETLLARLKEWHRINKHLSTAYSAKRRFAKRNATPFWSDLETIKGIYKKARELTEESGIQYHVDHIIPLVHPLVSGLHVPANLRIIPYYENLSKSNKLIEDIV